MVNKYNPSTSARHIHGKDHLLIYKITNLINGKIYVGQTTKTLEQRLAKHWSEAKCASRPNNYFHNALLKYGIENFIIEKLDTASSIEELNEKEYYWIEKLHSRDKDIGYNLMTGGKSGIKSEETKELLRQKKIANWDNDKLKLRMRRGLSKATEVWQSLCEEKRIEIQCPICGKKFKLPPHLARDRKFCSVKCAGQYSSKVASEVATEKLKEQIQKRNKKIRKDVKQWIINHQELIEACPANKISTTLEDLQIMMINKYDIQDWRSICQAICGSSSKKELLKYLKSECENICCSGLN